MPEVQPTNNPVPSDHPADARDNFKRIDEVVNLQASQSSPTRTGKTLRTLFGLEQEYISAIQQAGGVPLGVWSGGVTVFNAYNEFAIFNGVPYKPRTTASLPYTAQGSNPTISPDSDNVQPFQEITEARVSELSEQSVRDNTDIFYRASGSNSAIENMVAGIPIAASVGNICSTGGTTWRRDSSAAGNISDFTSLSSIEISDYGTDQNALESALNNHQGKKLTLLTQAYTFTSVPSNVNGVEIDASVKQRLLWSSSTAIPTTNSINTEGKETAIVACAIRWYDTTTTPPAPGAPGWYTLKDAGEEHDPILMGPVSTSGTSSLIVDVNFDDFGLSASQWTPSGFVVGPDETLADSGVTFGASVSSSQVTIRGTYNVDRTTFISFNGTSWSTGGYTFVSYSNGFLTLTRDANSTKAAINYQPNVHVTMRRQSSSDIGASIINCAGVNITGDTIQLSFVNADGTPVVTPTNRIKFYMTDNGLRNPDFNFGSNPGGGTNIWMVGAFVKREGFE